MDSWGISIYLFIYTYLLVYLFHAIRGTPKNVQRNPGFLLNLCFETGLYNMDILKLRFLL